MLEKLEFMIALAREKHFGRAAESCGVAQPTFSQGIQQLEEMLDAQLVKRSSRFLGFTPEGERVLVWARRLVADVNAMRQEIRGLRRGVDAHIRLAAMPSAMPLVASLTAPFQVANPSVHFTLITHTSDEITALLRDREIDAGIRYLGGDPRDVEEVPLCREEYLLLTTRDGPFGDSPHVGWAQLAGLRLCLFTTNLQHRRIVDSTLRSVGIDPAPMVETDSILAMTSHVLTGKWVSVVSSLVVSAIDVSGPLRLVPINEPQIDHAIGLVVSKRYPLPPAVALFMRGLSDGALHAPDGLSTLD